MITTYLKTKNESAAYGLRGWLRNVAGPVQGRAATEETVDEYENVIPAQEAVGDPAYLYVSILADFPIPPHGDFEACDTDTGKALCGEWA